MKVCLFEFVLDKVQLIQLNFNLITFLILKDFYVFIVFIIDYGFINSECLFFCLTFCSFFVSKITFSYQVLINLLLLYRIVLNVLIGSQRGSYSFLLVKENGFPVDCCLY